MAPTKRRFNSPDGVPRAILCTTILAATGDVCLT
jgi:hypothetical protein